MIRVGSPTFFTTKGGFQGWRGWILKISYQSIIFPEKYWTFSKIPHHYHVKYEQTNIDFYLLDSILDSAGLGNKTIIVYAYFMQIQP